MNAIADAESRGFNVKGSTLVSSLEPCCHTHKKTPPCTDLLIEKGIKTLYYGSVDLNPKVKGKGIKKLEKNNIETIFVDYQDINDELNRGALNIIRKNRPFVTLKICMTLDGMIYNKKTKNGSIGDSEQLEHSNNLRKMHDSVLVGVETIIKDNPKLTFRGNGCENFTQPRPIVLDTNLRIPLNSQIIRLGNNPIIFTKKNNIQKFNSLTKLGCTVIKLNNLKPEKILKNLMLNNLQSILVEGGGKVFSSFLSSDMYDELILYYSSNLIGNSGLNVSESLNKEYKIKKKSSHIKNIGNSVMMVFK